MFRHGFPLGKEVVPLLSLLGLDAWQSWGFPFRLLALPPCRQTPGLLSLLSMLPQPSFSSSILPDSQPCACRQLSLDRMQEGLGSELKKHPWEKS